MKPKAERPKRHERKRRNVNATPLGWHMTTPVGGCHIVVGGLKASPQRLKKKKKKSVRGDELDKLGLIRGATRVRRVDFTILARNNVKVK